MSTLSDQLLIILTTLTKGLQYFIGRLVRAHRPTRNDTCGTNTVLPLSVAVGIAAHIPGISNAIWHGPFSFHE